MRAERWVDRSLTEFSFNFFLSVQGKGCFLLLGWISGPRGALGSGISCNFMTDNQLQPTDRSPIDHNRFFALFQLLGTRGLEGKTK